MPIILGRAEEGYLFAEVVCDGDIVIAEGYREEDLAQDNPTPKGIIFRQTKEKNTPKTLIGESDVLEDTPWVLLGFTSVQSIDAVLEYLNHIKARMQESEGESQGENDG